jgi:hypothetical protein
MRPIDSERTAMLKKEGPVRHHLDRYRRSRDCGDLRDVQA